MALKLAQLQIQLNEKNKQLKKMEDVVSCVEADKNNLVKKVFHILSLHG